MENSRGTFVSSIAASTVLRNSFSEISSSPRASRWAFITMRRYLVTVTPGIATGYWKAMKRPSARALVGVGLGDVLRRGSRICALGDLERRVGP